MVRKKILKKIQEGIIRRIVDVAHPDRIIMFGSAARGEMGPHSDIDILVIRRGEENQRDIAGQIYRRLYGIGYAVDIIVVTPEQVERFKDSPCLVIYPALKEGVVIYDAGKITAR